MEKNLAIQDLIFNMKGTSFNYVQGKTGARFAPNRFSAGASREPPQISGTASR
jgi:hypothetical protein